MDAFDLQKSYIQHPSLQALAKVLSDPSVRTCHAQGLCASASAVVASALFAKSGRPLLYILDDEEEAGYFYHDLVQIQGEKQVLFFPSSYRRSIRYGQKDAANEILRTEVLARLQKKDGALIVVTFPEALAEQVISCEQLDENTLYLRKGQETDFTNLPKQLSELGFQREDYVYEPGQFAIRGSILDIFSFSSEYPYRIDFFGNEVESIRTFEVETQLSRDSLPEVAIIPELSHSAGGKSTGLWDFLPADTIAGLKNYEQLCGKLQALQQESLAPQALLSEQEEQKGTTPSTDLRTLLVPEDIWRPALDRFVRYEFGTHASPDSQASIPFSCHPQPLYHKNFDLAGEAFHSFLNQGFTLYICTDSEKQVERIRNIFEDKGDPIPLLSLGYTLHEGFYDDTLKICFFTDHQLFDRFHKYNLRSDKARTGKAALTLKEIQSFRIGDYVTHIDHGIGRFAGLVRLPMPGGATQEAIKLIYQGDDVVFVSIHSLHKLSKFKGREGEPPRISKLGTGAWEKMKERTKKKIKDIARDLIRLYAQRKETKGFAFSPDSFLQHELEASFIYEDTPDQLKATQAIKHDMESSIPMDRLVCGDVGFGKTEVAIRAAFKAATDGKQVAVLVPTTVLALQHYKTFSQRLKDFPCRVDYLSRGRTARETNLLLKDLAAGEIQILVGTHALIGSRVHFKDLGLLIIDEEQKFGVSVKEKLRQMRVNVDTLTLSATPIPRTLQFSLMGARDLSVINTPPPNRYPIQTEIHTFDEALIADAIGFEMSRGGQVFFVHNRVRDMEELAARIQRLVPDARICCAHGQMEPKVLEQTIFDFVNDDYDVLIATSIIENGIDISNVNTIIIDNAQNFGLSDLHQLRGRVGRSNRKAFCYLLAPPLSSLPDESRRRLQALEEFSDLGSGFHIALQDLDIRGAGNLLGSEQSGFIADVGYEAYQKILTQAVHELKTEEFAELYAPDSSDPNTAGENYVDECTVDSDLELLFPESYIPGSSERMLLYRELDNLHTDKELSDFRKRLEDRFGPVPPEGEELLRIAPLRRLACRLGIERILLKNGQMWLYFVSRPNSDYYYQSDTFGAIISYVQTHPKLCSLRESGGKRSLRHIGVPSVAEAERILTQMYNALLQQK